MRFSRAIAAALALAATVTSMAPAQAGGHHNDALIAGAVGFGVGAIFGGALAQPRYHYAPQPYYYRPAPPVVYEQRPLYQPAPVYVQPATIYAPAPWTQEWYAYCSSRYRSFNPSNGYFLGYDGQYHFCQ